MPTGSAGSTGGGAGSADRDAFLDQYLYKVIGGVRTWHPTRYDAHGEVVDQFPTWRCAKCRAPMSASSAPPVAAGRCPVVDPMGGDHHVPWHDRSGVRAVAEALFGWLP